MRKLTIGLVGYGNVGSGLVQFLQKKKNFIKNKFQVEFAFKAICDKTIPDRKPAVPEGTLLTADYKELLKDPEITTIVELIGGVHPAREIILDAIKNGKHVVTANKSVISSHGKELFEQAQAHSVNLLYESSVMAGVPSIKMLSEGLAGNKFNAVYGIINGTCNYILSEMTSKKLSFAQALEQAQKNGFAESDPTLDINGMDSAHKIAILVNLAIRKFINLKEIHTEGIQHISHDDIEHAERLGLTIKLLAIAKRVHHELEVRVHPTLISKDHPLASINGVMNALYIDADPMGKILMSGEGAGQMAAASGVVADLINLASRSEKTAPRFFCNTHAESTEMQVIKIDQIMTKFYLRFMATDKPGVLAQIAGVLGKYDVGINSVTQNVHNKAATVPVVMLTEFAPEQMVRQALEEIHKLPIARGKPVAIRMEKLS